MDKKDRKNRNKKIIVIGLRTLTVLCVVGLFGFLIYRIHVLENRQQQYASEIKGLTSELGLSAGNQGFTVSWAGKTWATYGDSITQNGGWQDYITEYFGFARHDNCGIGSSTFIQSDLVWYANPDGTYNSRYGFLGVTEAPEGTTEHEAYLCSEDRIQTQLDPDLDLVLIMGGTNDAGITVSAPLGDLSYPYDETTFMGAVASTVVKIQEQCPHAIIVLASPLSGRGPEDEEGMYEDQTEPEYNSLGLTTEDYARAMEEVAEYLSIPYIDVFGSTGINSFNRTQYISDIVHPNEEGMKAIARVVIGALDDLKPITEME